MNATGNKPLPPEFDPSHTRAVWPTYCIVCGWDASYQQPETTLCLHCGGSLVCAHPYAIRWLVELAAHDSRVSAYREENDLNMDNFEVRGG